MLLYEAISLSPEEGMGVDLQRISGTVLGKGIAQRRRPTEWGIESEEDRILTRRDPFCDDLGG